MHTVFALAAFGKIGVRLFVDAEVVGMKKPARGGLGSQAYARSGPADFLNVAMHAILGHPPQTLASLGLRGKWAEFHK